MNTFFKKRSDADSSTIFIQKYKPYYIDDFCVEPKFKSVLKTLIEIDDLNILIHGSAGSGKTCLLYAILRNYYGLSKTQSLPENNLLFINTLKEQGVNYYRNEMKTFCQSRCSIYGKKKIIVIDDIDCINEQCQQMFRNYIDKYRNNVHFLSVCSNVQKVIESIQSRVHIIRMQPPTKEEIRGIVDKIIENEKIRIDEKALDYIQQFSNHSLREMMNHLEKIFILQDPKKTDAIDYEKCKQICSNISLQSFEDYIGRLRNNELAKAIHILYNIHDYGYSVIDIFDYFYGFVKSTDQLNEIEKYKIISCLCKYITYFYNIHENVIELALFSRDVLRIVGNG